MLEPRHAEEIAGRFALGDRAELTGPVARGELGQVWRLETSTGPWAVKERFRSLSEDEAREDAAVQDAARAAGIPTPETLRTRDGDVLAEIGGAPVRGYEWVDLRDRDPSLDPASVGELVARIHRAPLPQTRPEHPWYRDPVGAKRWDELVELVRAAGASFAEQFARYRDELVALEGLLVPPMSLQTCHRDLWADNLRSTVDGELCVIDWEDFGLADPSQELALVMFEFATGDARRAHTLRDAYVGAGGPGRVRERGDFSMLIAQIGHIGESAFEQWLESEIGGPEREHAAARVDEFLSQPVTRSGIDELLDAIRR